MVMNISCKFEKSTYDTLASREVTREYLYTAVDGYNNKGDITFSVR